MAVWSGSGKPTCPEVLAERLSLVTPAPQLVSAGR